MKTPLPVTYAEDVRDDNFLARYFLDDLLALSVVLLLDDLAALRSVASDHLIRCKGAGTVKKLVAILGKGRLLGKSTYVVCDDVNSLRLVDIGTSSGVVNKSSLAIFGAIPGKVKPSGRAWLHDLDGHDE